MKTLFIDRDGVINRMVHYEYGYDSPQTVDDVTLTLGILPLITWANKHDLLVVEISNQPGFAKGKQSLQQLLEIDNHVSELLEQGGARIDHKYICKHHQDSVIPELKIDCECRKPKPGLIFQASRDYEIDLTSSIFYGDNNSDVLAGKSAGCQTMILLHNEDTTDKIKSAHKAQADYKVNSHQEALEVLKRIYSI